ncbi:hypothetical protein [Amycolatopsis sp. NPDC051903]|uniref:hypothetical protein n=1 Tax=Amycolatopsis sp. NPDC051903 TaxID=3363936 RepID=UPI0037989C12
MGIDSGPALARLHALMVQSRRWREQHPDQVAAVPPGYVSTEKSRRVEDEAAAAFDWSRLVYGQWPEYLAWPQSTLQQVVGGPVREQLLDWLPEMAGWWVPQAELAALGDLTRDSTGQDARQLLLEEGFSPLPGAVLHPCHRLQLMLHAADGLLAEIHEAESLVDPAGGFELRHVRVYGCVKILDRDLLHTGTHGISNVLDGDRQRTRFAAGRLTGLPGGGAGSLRVALAVLRAATRPALPWPHPPITTWMGPGSLPGLPADSTHEDTVAASTAATRRVLDDLPRHVHELLGPNLMTR